MTRRPLQHSLKQLRGDASDIVERQQEAWDDPRHARRRDVRGLVLHEPSGPEENDRHRQLSEHLLHDAKLGEQVWPRNLRADR